jgi:hypothetical protein
MLRELISSGAISLTLGLLPGMAHAGYDVDLGELRIAYVTADGEPVPEASVSLYVGTYDRRVEADEAGWFGYLHLPLYAVQRPADSRGEGVIPGYAQRSDRARYHGTELSLRFGGLYEPACQDWLTELHASWDAGMAGLVPGPDCSATAGSEGSDRLVVSAQRLICRMSLSRAQVDEALRVFRTRCR